jgi:hypothetical protein
MKTAVLLTILLLTVVSPVVAQGTGYCGDPCEVDADCSGAAFLECIEGRCLNLANPEDDVHCYFGDHSTAVGLSRFIATSGTGLEWYHVAGLSLAGGLGALAVLVFLLLRWRRGFQAEPEPPVRWYGPLNISAEVLEAFAFDEELSREQAKYIGKILDIPIYTLESLDCDEIIIVPNRNRCS